jgi:hypothetical protein
VSFEEHEARSGARKKTGKARRMFPNIARFDAVTKR